MSARTRVLDALEELLADTPGLEDVEVIRSPRAVDYKQHPIAQARTQNYAPLPEAPLTKVIWTGTITLVSPHADTLRAEDQLEEMVEALLTASRSGRFRLGEATLVAYGENSDGSPTNLALDVAVTSIFQKE